jgi:hypothetical protein
VASGCERPVCRSQGHVCQSHQLFESQSCHPECLELGSGEKMKAIFKIMFHIRLFCQLTDSPMTSTGSLPARSVLGVLC